MPIDPQTGIEIEKVDDDDRLTMLAVLSVGNYVTEAKSDEARQRLADNPGIYFGDVSARDLLDWLIAEGYTDRDAEEAATQQNLQWSEDRSVALDKRIAVMAFLRDVDPRIDARLQALLDGRRKKAKTKFLINCGVVVVIAAGIGAYMLMPTSTPTCGDSSTVSTLDSIVFDSEMKSGTLAQTAPGDRTKTGNYREVGYDEKKHSRGCLADVSIGKDKAPIGYVVRRTDEDSNRFGVQTYPPEYVSSRYAAATLANRFGAPVGRDNMETAMKAALAHVDSQVASNTPHDLKTERDGGTPSLADSVLDVIPTADCKALADGRQSCPVAIDYQDDLMSIVGGPAVTKVNGEFVFVKDGNGWAMSDDFPDAFLKAVVAGRLASVQATLKARGAAAAGAASN